MIPCIFFFHLVSQCPYRIVLLDIFQISLLDYCNSLLYLLPLPLATQFQHNTRVIFKKNRSDPRTPLLKTIQRHFISLRVKSKFLRTVYKAPQDTASATAQLHLRPLPTLCLGRTGLLAVPGRFSPAALCLCFPGNYNFLP